MSERADLPGHRGDGGVERDQVGLVEDQPRLTGAGCALCRSGPRPCGRPWPGRGRRSRGRGRRTAGPRGPAPRPGAGSTAPGCQASSRSACPAATGSRSRETRAASRPSRTGTRSSLTRPHSLGVGGPGPTHHPAARASLRGTGRAPRRAPSPRTPPPPAYPHPRSAAPAHRTTPPPTPASGSSPSASPHVVRLRGHDVGVRPRQRRLQHLDLRASAQGHRRRGPLQHRAGAGGLEGLGWWTCVDSPRAHRHSDLPEHICGELFPNGRRSRLRGLVTGLRPSSTNESGGVS